MSRTCVILATRFSGHIDDHLVVIWGDVKAVEGPGLGCQFLVLPNIWLGQGQLCSTDVLRLR